MEHDNEIENNGECRDVLMQLLTVCNTVDLSFGVIVSENQEAHFR